MRSFLPVFMVLLLLTGCEDTQEIHPPDPLLDESTYLNVLIDLKLFNAMVQSTDTLIVNASMRLEIFDHYGIPEEVFLNNHAYYQSFPEQQQVRLDSAIKIVESQLDSIRQSNEPLRQPSN